MASRPFKQVDVFTTTPYRGNPLAVVLDGNGLSTAEMQHFTNWTNLSECTFLLPPTDEGRANGADYRVRIFCPGRELPFAGHPTLGSCHAWLEAGGLPRGEHVVQECGVGLVKLRRDGERLAFAAPPLIKSGPLAEEDVQLIARGLGVAREDITAHAWCDNGPNWRGVLLRSAEQVLGNKACQQHRKVLYLPAGELFDRITIAERTGDKRRCLDVLVKVELLIIDDWFLTPPTRPQVQQLHTLIDRRHKNASTIYCTQLPPGQWHDRMEEKILADAIVDRITTNAHTTVLDCDDSLRKHFTHLE